VTPAGTSRPIRSPKGGGLRAAKPETGTSKARPSAAACYAARGLMRSCFRDVNSAAHPTIPRMIPAAAIQNPTAG